MAADAGKRRGLHGGEIAVREKINKSYVSRVLPLTLLAPQIVEAILDGRQLPEMTLLVLIKPLPAAWTEQRKSAAHVQNAIPAIDPVACL
jgi:hypothetical protein